jgi:multiple antibiotic resistance protein
MSEWGHIIIIVVTALFPIVDPIGAIPVFLAITERDSVQYRNYQLRKACLYVFGILTIFLVAGNIIMKFFGISIPGIRIAGGLVLFRIAQDMLQAKPKYKQSQKEHIESVHKTDVSFTPLAMPLLSGPGAIAITLGLTTLVDHWYDYLIIIGAIGTIAVSCWVILHASTKIITILGITGMNIITRMMGFLILCVSIQFVINGVLNIITDKSLLQQILEIYLSLRSE